MIKTYTYKIKPNKAIERKFEEQVGICRYVYNLAREVREESFKKGLSINHYDLSRQLTIAKKDFDWLRGVNSQSLQLVLEILESGYKRFFSDLKKGIKTSKPHWAKKDKWRILPFKTIKPTFNGYKLARFGVVKVFNFKVPKGELRTASIVKEADGLYLKIAVREESTRQISDNQSICAIDMGIKYFLVTSDSEYVENPKHLFNYLKKLRIENRKLARMKKGGSNYKKQVRVLQLLYQKTSRVRKDFLHKKSRVLSNNYSTVIRENLKISNMARNSNLAKYILDCAWGDFFMMLEYKTNVVSKCCLYFARVLKMWTYLQRKQKNTKPV